MSAPPRSDGPAPVPRPGDDQPTRWTLVLRAQQQGEPGQEALAELFQRYRELVANYFRRTLANYDPENETSAFLSITLGGLARTANPEKGRFRDLLWSALHRHRNQSLRRFYAQKRGGGAIPSPLDTRLADSVGDPDGEDSDFRTEFDREFAHTVFRRAHAATLSEWMTRKSVQGRSEVAFDCLVGSQATLPLAKISELIQCDEGWIKKNRSEQKARLREAFRTEVETVVGRAQAEEEARYLQSLLLRARRT